MDASQIDLTVTEGSRMTRVRGGRLMFAYAASGLAAAALFALIGVYGARTARGAADAARFAQQATREVHSDAPFYVLVAIAVVALVAQLMRGLARACGQPVVIGEIIAGMLLGPCFTSSGAPHFAQQLLRPLTVPYLAVWSQFGIVLYMFLVGLEFDLRVLRTHGANTLAISHASILAPFLLGATASIWLYPGLAGPGAPFSVFSLFVGLAMSVTAFPVLARILADRGMLRTRLGMIALGCAAVDDVTAWCCVALMLGLARLHYAGVLFTLTLTIVYLLAMFCVVRPLIEKALGQRSAHDRERGAHVALALIGVVLSALATESIGIHAIFGAFVLGAVIPHDSRLAGELTRKLEDPVNVLFLPIFFTQLGMHLDLGALGSESDRMLWAAIIAIASVGKIGSGALASRLCGFSLGNAARLGVLMNTRGLMELVVVSLGLELRVISARLFTAITVMTLVTTVATVPLLQLIDYLCAHRYLARARK